MANGGVALRKLIQDDEGRSDPILIAIVAAGGAGVLALAAGLLLEVDVLFLGGVIAVVGAFVGHNMHDAHQRRRAFERRRSGDDR
jgi:hypothetical protein